MKKKKKRRKPNLKSPNSRTWRDKADDAWRDQINAIGKCEICPRTTNLNAHHLISRTRLRFRHDLSNGICLCSWHHLRDPHCSPHSDSYSDEGFIEWLKINRPGQFQWFEEHKKDMRPGMEGTYQDKWEQLQ